MCESKKKTLISEDLSSPSSLSETVAEIFKWQMNLYINARKFKYFLNENLLRN